MIVRLKSDKEGMGKTDSTPESNPETVTGCTDHDSQKSHFWPVPSLSTSITSSLRKVFITESARNKLSSSHHAPNSLLFALDGYPTATEDPAEIEETARTETIGGGDTGSGREHQDWVPLTGDPLFPSGRLYFSTSITRHKYTPTLMDRCYPVGL